jgi:hypothetical protein
VKIIDVHRVAFERNEGGTKLTIHRYPVSHIEDAEARMTRFSVNWHGGDGVESTTAKPGAESDRLAARAATLRAQGFARTEVDSRVAAVLGPNSRPLTRR